MAGEASGVEKARDVGGFADQGVVVGGHLVQTCPTGPEPNLADGGSASLDRRCQAVEPSIGRVESEPGGFVWVRHSQGQTFAPAVEVERGGEVDREWGGRVQ